MEKSVFLKDVLSQMDLKTPDGFAVPFDISVREFSAQSKSGGKLRYYNDARLLISKPKKHGKNLMNLLAEKKSVRNPNHFENQTRNIELASGDIKKINIRFIIQFNGKEVVY